jgi:hypothetical protein
VTQGSRTVGTLGISGEFQMRLESTPATAEGKFVITLCSVPTPVTIPQPRSPQLTRFKFFLGTSLEAGRKSYTLYMGYFTTPTEAEKWLGVLRGIYPEAFVSERSATQPDSFSDTQVLSILEKRGSAAGAGADTTAAGRNISLLRPDDTSTRLALKDAVARNAPVSFAMQLQWSTQPIELDTAPRHPIFSSYTLYTTQARLDGREWFCLRLGFFSDAISAKQVAQYLFSDFPSVAVVPVNPAEYARALETGRRSTGAVCSAQTSQERNRKVEAVRANRGTSARAAVPVAPSREKRGAVTLEETLETLRTSEFDMYGDDESNSTGVRHLQVVKERPARYSSSSAPQRRK